VPEEKGGTSTVFKKILVPIDGSPTSDRGLAEAIQLAKETGATLCLLHVVNEMGVIQSLATEGTYVEGVLEILRAGGKRILKKAEARVRKRGVRTRSVLIENLGSRVADVIVRQAKKWGANLIVLGTHGRRGLSRLVMGSDAEGVVRTSPVPVLLVRSKERGTRGRGK
jgi:nucleotide-binding universal stress UspA family protein